MRIYIWIAILTLLLISCNSVINTVFDDTTARYNAYFLANESIEEIESELLESTIENYDSIINLSYEIDTNKVSGINEKEEDIVKKLSILIQRHPGSKYVFPSYSLIGKARLLALDLNQSITTLKYVNSRSDSELAKQMSLIFLMRAYTEKEDYNAAIEVLNFLKKNTIDKELLEEYHLNAHYLFKKLNSRDDILNELYSLEKIVRKRSLLNRIYFAIGQIHLFNKDYDSAKNSLKQCLSNNPSFDMEFNAKIFYARTLINDNETEINKYFSKLIRDKKNIEKLDRIYYEIGLLSENKEKFMDAIQNYTMSVINNTKNKNLLFYSYKKTADIYYDKLNDYRSAKLYYDSALNNINREFKDYKKLKEKSDILTELVDNLETINTNDSLIYLTSIPEEELNNILENNIKNSSEKKKKEKLRGLQQNFIPSESKIILGNNSDGGWYFDNESILSIGKNDFQRIWGNRELKDNWRLISKISFNTETEVEESILISEESIENKTKVEKDENTVIALKDKLPFTQSEKDRLNKETEIAYYKVGKVYIQKLEEKEKGIKTYNEFIKRFNKSEYLAEVYYQLYLISSESKKYKNLILTNHSDTEYYKLIINPNYQVDEFQELNLLKKLYNIIYENLKMGNNQRVIKNVDSLSMKYEENPFFENILLLKSIAKGKEAGNFSLQYELKKFLKKAIGESSISYASTLLKSAKDVHDNFIFSGLPIFRNNSDSVFYLFMITESKFKENLNIRLQEILTSSGISEEIYEFSLDNSITFNVISLKEKKILNSIKSKFNSSLTSVESNGNTNFVVGEKNMNLIFKSKNYREFIKFINK